MGADLSSVAAYLAQDARRRPLLDPEGEADRDPTGLVRQLLEVMGGRHLPALAGYRLGPSHPSAFAGSSHPCVAAGETGLRIALRPSPRGVDASHASRSFRYAPSTGSALRRLVDRDRSARRGYTFRIHAPLGDKVASLLGCAPSEEWDRHYQGELALVDEVLFYTDVDCHSLEGARRLLAAAEAHQLPLTLREDEPSRPCPVPSEAASLTVRLDPRDRWLRPRTSTDWDGPALLELEVRGDAIVQTRFAFGAAVDQRVGRAGSVGRAAADRALGSPRVEAYLARHATARRLELSRPAALEGAMAARGLDELQTEAVRLETIAGGLIGAGPLGGVAGIFISPGVLFECVPRASAAVLPRVLTPPSLVQRLGDSAVEGFLCGWLDSENPLFIDRRGWLYTVDDNGDEHPRACGPIKLLEKLALAEELAQRCETAVVVDADLAAPLAKRLGAARVDEASDEISELFVSGAGDATRPLIALERSRFPRLVGAPMRTLVWTETPEILIAAARFVRELAPSATFEASDPWEHSGHRMSVLRRAGFETRP